MEISDLNQPAVRRVRALLDQKDISEALTRAVVEQTGITGPFKIDTVNVTAGAYPLRPSAEVILLVEVAS